MPANSEHTLRNLTPNDIQQFKTLLTSKPLGEVVPSILDHITLDHGFWRFFGSSNDSDPYSHAAWNAPDLWKHAWQGLASRTFWGEDLFGNQILLDNQANVFLWDHENASISQTDLDLLTILETSLQHGLGWLDFYADGSHALVKNRQAELPIDSHWHWIDPKILGGPITLANLSPILRVQHMTAHGQIWMQLREIPPGTQIVINR
jgi:hypothetical protein